MGPYVYIQIRINWLCRKVNLPTQICTIVQAMTGETRESYTTLLKSTTNNNILLVGKRKWESKSGPYQCSVIHVLLENSNKQKKKSL